jgi:hypothetical protein
MTLGAVVTVTAKDAREDESLSHGGDRSSAGATARRRSRPLVDLA